MGTKYNTSFAPYLELFEPRSAYISELRLQHAWKNALYGRFHDLIRKAGPLKVLSPGRHNHSDGPDFIGASVILDGKLLYGDIEIHHWVRDSVRPRAITGMKATTSVFCMLFFRTAEGRPAVKCSNGVIPATCYVPLEEAMEWDIPESCRIFKPNNKKYFEILKKKVETESAERSAIFMKIA